MNKSSWKSVVFYELHKIREKLTKEMNKEDMGESKKRYTANGGLKFPKILRFKIPQITI